MLIWRFSVRFGEARAVIILRKYLFASDVSSRRFSLIDVEMQIDLRTRIRAQTKHCLCGACVFTAARGVMLRRAVSFVPDLI